MKKLSITLALLLAVTSVVGSTAAAETPDNYTEYDFEDDLVQGDLVRPDGVLVATARRWDRMSLIRIRDNFIDRLIWSMEWL